MSAHAHEYNRNESDLSLCGRSRRSGASGTESETFRGARGQPPYLLATFRHLRGVFARTRDMRSDPASLHNDIWQTRPRLVDQSSRAAFGLLNLLIAHAKQIFERRGCSASRTASGQALAGTQGRSEPSFPD